MSIKKENIEWFIIIAIMAFSFINNMTLLVSMLASFFLLQQKEIGAIKIINLITFRTIINPGIAINIGNLQNFKWIILFVCSFYLIQSYLKFNDKQKLKLKRIIIGVLIFSIYNIISSFIFSTLPTIAIFKLISYSVMFLGLLIGIMVTMNKYNWLKWMYKMFNLLILFSIPFMVLPVGYLRNENSFQGITNQPNMFAIVSALSIALSLTILPSIKRKKLYSFFLLITTMYMIILSNSRTSFISTLIMILLYLFFNKKHKIIKSLNYILYFFVGLIIVFFTNAFEFFDTFLHKGNADILYSRSKQIDGLMNNFFNNPLFGNGFAVPVTPFRSFSFSTDYIVEPGNLMLAVLSYSGIIGFIIFIIYLINIFLSGKQYFRRTLYLPLSAVMISMGEMVFFSSNSIGIWCYMFLGIYISISKSQLEEML